MRTQTLNYSNLVECIESTKEAYKLASATYHPSVLVERCNSLLVLFAEKYLESSENRNELATDIIRRPEIVTALFFSIVEQLNEAEAMLLECQEFEPNCEKTQEKSHA